MPPPTDPQELDQYVLDLVMGWRPRHKRFEVAEIEYVRTSRRAATDGAVPWDTDVLFVQVSGVFSVPPHSRPPGVRMPEGDVSLLSCAIDARTGQALDGGFGGKKIDTSALGAVRRLSPWSATR
jgi:hypothetical protein